MILNYIEALEPGAKVSVRELSAVLGVSEGTAYKAVKDAEQRGLVLIKPKAGTVRVDTEPKEFGVSVLALDVARLLGLSIVGGKAAMHREVKRLVICDGSEAELKRQLRGQEAGACLCLCGGRPELHAAVVEQGANLLVTGGAKVHWSLVSLADRNGQYILSSPQSSYSLLRMFDAEYADRMDFSGGSPVEEWMQTPDYLYHNDIVADWQRLYTDSSMTKQYPLVDDELRICAGLDLWKAAAAVPSQRLRSLSTEKLEFPCVSVQDDIRDVARKFVVNGEELAAVLDGERMVGVITSNDLLRHYMFSQPGSYEFNADAFLRKDAAGSTEDTVVYSVRIPDPELKNIQHIEMDLMLSAAGEHVRQLGCASFKFESGTFFAPKRIESTEGLLLISRAQHSGPNTYVIETEINDDSVSYAKAVLIASGYQNEQEE